MQWLESSHHNAMINSLIKQIVPFKVVFIILKLIQILLKGVNKMGQHVMEAIFKVNIYKIGM